MPLPDDESFTHLADQERKRREKLRSYGPVVRYALIVVLVLGAVLGASLLVRDRIEARELASLRNYFGEVADLVKRTNDVGARLTSLIRNPGTLTRKDVQTRLEQYTKVCAEIAADTHRLRPPALLSDAQRWLEAAADLRVRGLEELTPALMNSLEVVDNEVAAEQISRAMQKFVLADLCYSEFFAAPATGVARVKQIDDVTIAAARFIDDHDLASRTGVLKWLADFKSAEQLRAIHGLALIKVVAQPSGTVISAGGTYNLKSTDQLRFLVTVENQGNMTETDVPVTVRLQGPDTSQPQIVSVKIPEIKAKQSKEVEIRGVNPTAYGEKALLRVEVGPVPNEKNVENNSLEAFLVFVL